MKHLKLLVATALIILTAASCKKTPAYEPPPAVSAVSFFNASPDGPPVSMYINTSKIQQDSLAYKGSIYYVNAYSGDRELSAYQGAVKKVFKTVTLGEGKIYSAYLTGKWANAEFVVLVDSLTTPAPSKANIRFINMSVESPSLDLGLSDGTTLISGKTYKDNGSFIAIDANKQYNFVIREHGSTVNKVLLPSVVLDYSHSYTIWARGIYTATGNTAFSADVVKNY